MTRNAANSTPTEQANSDFDLVILDNDYNSAESLRKIAKKTFPQAAIKLFHNLDRVKLPSQSTTRLLLLSEFNSLQADSAPYINRLRSIFPAVKVCIVANEGDLVKAFDQFGSFADDIFLMNEELGNSLQSTMANFHSTFANVSKSDNEFNVVSLPSILLIESTFDACVVANGDGLLLYGNSSWLDHFANPNSEHIYLSDIVHPNDIHRLEADLQLAIIEKGSSRAVFRVRSKKGEWETLQTTITGLESGGVHVAYICAKIVTESHRLQVRLQELETQNALFRTYTEAVVYRYNAQSGSVQFISHNQLEQFGYTGDEIRDSGKPLYALLIPDSDLPEFQSHLETIVRRVSGNPQNSTLTHNLICGDGKLIPVKHSLEIDWSRDGSQYWINGAIRAVDPSPNQAPSQAKETDDRERLFEAMLEGMVEFELIDGIPGNSLKFISCNIAFENLTGFSRKRILNSFLDEIFPGLRETPLNIDSEESLPDVLTEVAMGGTSRNVEDYFWPHLHAYFNISAISIRSGCVSVLLTDITRRKHAEIRLATLLRGLPDTALYQTGGGIEYISDGITQMLGYPVEAFHRDRNFFVELIHPDDQKLLHLLQKKWTATGSRGVLEMEFRARHRDGHYIWILDRMSKAFTAPDGKQSSQGVMIDITKRKELEEQRRIETTEMEAIFRTLPDLLFRLNYEGIILDYKSGNDDFLLLTPDHFLNKSMFDILPEAVSSKYRKAVEKVIKSHHFEIIDYQLEVPAGKHGFEARIFWIAENSITAVIRKK